MNAQDIRSDLIAAGHQDIADLDDTALLMFERVREGLGLAGSELPPAGVDPSMHSTDRQLADLASRMSTLAAGIATSGEIEDRDLAALRQSANDYTRRVAQLRRLAVIDNPTVCAGCANRLTYTTGGQGYYRTRHLCRASVTRSWAPSIDLITGERSPARDELDECADVNTGRCEMFTPKPTWAQRFRDALVALLRRLVSRGE